MAEIMTKYESRRNEQMNAIARRFYGSVRMKEWTQKCVEDLHGKGYI